MKKQYTARIRKTVHKINPVYQALLATLVAAQMPIAYGLVISEDFTGGTTRNNWLMPLPSDGLLNSYSAAHPRAIINNACLTAGSGTTVPTATRAGSPPRCRSTHDTAGNGALRLTPTEQQMVGGIVSDFTFDTNEGVEITFTTYTWGGTGADGMTFFLVDGAKPATLGASGGSLGYTCARDNPVFSGIDGAYLGIGIDEWGNFVNPGDNSSTGVGFRPNTIGIRGAGSINYNYMSNPDRFLQDVYSRMGWGAVPQSIKDRWRRDWTDRSNWGQWNTPLFRRMTNICTSGKVQVPNARGQMVELSTTATDPRYKIYGYKYIAHKTLPNPLATTAAKLRSNAVPMLYRIRITADGKASVWYSYNAGEYQPVLMNYDIVKENGYLPKSFRFGFMGATGGSTNNHEVTCFKATPANFSEGSAEVNLPDAKIASESQVYLSFYNKELWTGSLTAQNILRKPDGTYTVQPTANWDAACALAGGPCERKGKQIVNKQTVRKFFTWNGTGIALEWDNLNPLQKNALKSPGETDTIGSARVAYLKGDQSREVDQNGNGMFRPRKNGMVLGDIINSSPVWVGYPSNKGLLSGRLWRDLRNPGAIMPENNGQPYATFANLNRTRTNVVYTGSNDGFLHGFRSGNYNATGQFQTGTNDGQEVFAYMPGAVLSRIHHKTDAGLDFFSPQYAHNYYNDAPVGTGDVFYGGAWHTWIMGGLGAGGDTIYALDVTNPDSFNASNVIGEWSRSSGGVWSNLGNTYGTPVFGRFHDGNWGAVFGNGWCSTTDAANGNCTASGGPAGIYVMSIDQNTGRPSFKFISTGEVGTPASPNGIAYVTPIDLDGDNIYDYAYAGDILGNVWRFNLLSSNSNDWTSQPQKLFTAPAIQPISTKIIVTRMEQNGTSGDVILNFGTGMRKEGYLGGKTTYATGQQSIYGIRDKTALAFSMVPGTTTPQVDRSRMQRQVVHDGGKQDQLSNMKVDWNTKSGWYLDLTRPTINGKVEYEQVIYNPYLERGKYLIANTFIDGSNPVLSCRTVQSSGYTYPFEATSGSGLRGFFDNNFTGSSYRKQLNAVGAPILLRTTDGKLLLLTKDNQGNPNLHEVYLPETSSIRRISWREIF